MAISHHPLWKAFRGHMKKTVVVKRYPYGRTIITTYPDMSGVKPGEGQVKAKRRFADVVVYARNIRADAAGNQSAAKRLSNRKGKLYHPLLAGYRRLN